LIVYQRVDGFGEDLHPLNVGLRGAHGLLICQQGQKGIGRRRAHIEPCYGLTCLGLIGQCARQIDIRFPETKIERSQEISSRRRCPGTLLGVLSKTGR